MKNGYKLQKNKENGFTLLEILAALAIMGVLIVVMIPFFTNYAVFTSKAEENVDAINLAEKVMYEVEDEYPIDVKSIHASCNSNALLKLSPGNGLPDTIEGDKLYNVKVYVCKTNDRKSTMYQLKVELWNDQTLITETFTYLNE
ncbi:type II secretion system protein [Pontibacillus salipaludis]|uniref:Prepilin-type N-terminal cleavage/methylation domain-containing protein n=1 Tax=Pontibacillus salipaludis TaxID=1697394 RepID=A0ABQ1PTM9_9BACI|nr:prepilin-type N-terminal cleavage/methylation domain-containing protein [Pontibacillus salipaludis]GGD03444.1 hypothetical protein GCM10011389_08700 [Pontibacillus salipaludis]